MADVFYEATPNPQALRFIVTESATTIAQRTQDFEADSNLSLSPLAKKLFGFPWCVGVMIAPHSVTVTKEEWVDWETLADPLAQIIKEHIESGEPVLLDAPPSHETLLSDDPVIQKIFNIIESDIRPAVAMDGGDIIFEGYKDGVVSLHMVGACAGCPSSMYTLKEGIETRLKDLVPEVKEVISI
jgi:Fe-S cluster biogenesis protein NfuA